MPGHQRNACMKKQLLTFCLSLLSLPLAAQQFTLPAGYESQQQKAVAIASADFNGDGKSDFAFAVPSSQQVTLLLAGPNGSYQAVALAIPGISSLDSITDLVAADIDGNGRIDLVVGTTNGTVVFLQNNGSLEYKSTIPGSVQAFSVEDQNHDTHLDLTLLSPTGALTVALGNGDGTFAAPFAVTSDALASSVNGRARGKE